VKAAEKKLENERTEDEYYKHLDQFKKSAKVEHEKQKHVDKLKEKYKRANEQLDEQRAEFEAVKKKQEQELQKAAERHKAAVSNRGLNNCHKLCHEHRVATNTTMTEDRSRQVMKKKCFEPTTQDTGVKQIEEDKKEDKEEDAVDTVLLEISAQLGESVGASAACPGDQVSCECAVFESMTADDDQGIVHLDEQLRLVA
jgi:hypothetical protein